MPIAQTGQKLGAYSCVSAVSADICAGIVPVSRLPCRDLKCTTNTQGVQEIPRLLLQTTGCWPFLHFSLGGTYSSMSVVRTEICGKPVPVSWLPLSALHQTTGLVGLVSWELFLWLRKDVQVSKRTQSRDLRWYGAH